MNARLSYDSELRLLQDELIKMGAAANKAISESITALSSFDDALCREVIENDSTIDNMEREIEHRCFSMLLRQQPVAGDLRKISTAIKMITDIERIGDAAADIAEIARHIEKQNIPACFDRIPEMAHMAQKMVEDSITSYVNADLQLAHETRLADDKVDEIFNLLKHSLADEMVNGSKAVDTLLDCLMIIKYLERLGDHAVNICEWVEFCETGIHKNTCII